MKTKIILSFFIAFLFCIGCKEDKFLMMDDISLIQMNGVQSMKYSFLNDPDVEERDTVYFDLITVGGPRSFDRTLRLEQYPETYYDYAYDKDSVVIDSTLQYVDFQAVPDLHYVNFNSSEYLQLNMIPAGDYKGKAAVILLKDPSLKEEEYRLAFRIVETEDFGLGLDDKRTGIVSFADRLLKPGNWPVYNFGTYSVRKHMFFIEIAGVPINETWIKETQKISAEMRYYRMKFKEALFNYNNDPENIANGLAPMREEQDDPESPLIVMP